MLFGDLDGDGDEDADDDLFGFFVMDEIGDLGDDNKFLITPETMDVPGDDEEDSDALEESDPPGR